MTRIRLRKVKKNDFSMVMAGGVGKIAMPGFSQSLVYYWNYQLHGFINTRRLNWQSTMNTYQDVMRRCHERDTSGYVGSLRDLSHNLPTNIQR